MVSTTPFERSIIVKAENMKLEELIEYGNGLTKQLSNYEFGSMEYAVVLTNLLVASSIYDQRCRPPMRRR